MWYMGLDSNNKPNGWTQEPFEDYIEVSDEIKTIHEINPNYVWDGITLNAPVVITPEPFIYIPQSVSMRQARLQLAKLGTYNIVNNAVNMMDEVAKIQWEYATSVERNNPITAAIIQLLGWTEEQTDQYFIDASTL